MKRVLDVPKQALRRAWSLPLRNRHRLPNWAIHLLDRTKWATVGALARLRGYSPASFPAEELPADWPKAQQQRRLLIGATNFAGQGDKWAKVVSQEPGWTARSWAFEAQRKFNFSADYRLPISANAASRDWQLKQFNHVITHYDAVVLESGRPLFGRLFNWDASREIVALQDAGLRVACLWHGTDIRLPSEHAAREPKSPYALPKLRRWSAEIESTAKYNRRLLKLKHVPHLVSTPDLLLDLPTAQWVPVVVPQDLAVVNGEARTQTDLVTVVHIPSNRVVKGTDLLEPELRLLAELERLNLVVASNIASDQVLELYASADLVLDQFRLGIYGVAAVEAMTLGAVVVSDVADSVRQLVLQRTGEDLPIIQAVADDVASTVQTLATVPQKLAGQAAQGQKFAALVHDGRKSAQAIIDALGD